MKIYIGHDSNFPKATKVCIRSIQDHSKPWEHEIKYLDKKSLTKVGVYGRENVPGESTEFSFTRFYVPMLCHYKETALFCDNDFLFKCNPTELEKYLKNKPVAVVKHKLDNIHGSKMDGVENKSYPKKCWSSLMLFDNSKLKHLTKEYLDDASPADLHQFAWVDEKDISEIPRSYNHLVGYYKKHNRIKAIHYTQGGPWFEEYKNGEFSEEWWEVYKSL
jgi:lipopolysaccharide biosynthesis glycosyltransferase